MKPLNPIVLLAAVVDKLGGKGLAESGYKLAASRFDSPQAWSRLGRRAMQQENWQRGIHCYEKAARGLPNDAELQFKLGLCYLKSHRWEPAKAAIGHAIELDPSRQQWQVQYKKALAGAGHAEAVPRSSKAVVAGSKAVVTSKASKLNWDLQTVELLLKARILSADFAGFDALLAATGATFEFTEGATARLLLLKFERLAAQGHTDRASEVAGELAAHALFGPYVQGVLGLRLGDYASAIGHLQEFVAAKPKEAVGVRLLARAARLSGNPEIAWRVLTPVLSAGGESLSWAEAARLVADATDFDRVFVLWNQFKQANKPSLHYLKVVGHVAHAAARSGSTALATRLLEETVLASKAMKVAPLPEVYTAKSSPEFINLPDDLTRPDGVVQRVLENVKPRYLCALQGLTDVLQAAGVDHFAVRRCLAFIVRSDLSPGLRDPVEVGVIGAEDFGKALDAVTASALFWVMEGSEPGSTVLRGQHANGIAVTVYLHEAAGDSLTHRDRGLEWTHQRFGTRRADVAGLGVPLPADPVAYARQFSATGTTAMGRVDYVVAAANARVVDASAFKMHLHELLLDAIVAGSETDTQKLVIKLGELGEKEFIRKFYESGGNYAVANVVQLKEDRPQVALYLSGMENVAYQGNQWIPVLERLSARCMIVIREKRIAAQLMPTRLPIYFFDTLRDLEILEEVGVRTILYPANSQKATQSLRLHRLNHFFINHGESDKVVNQSKFLMAYDKLLVAGPLAERRLRESGLPVRDGQVVHVGRPQTELMLKRVAAASGRIKTILYAPTWEGFSEESNYSSISQYGLQMLETLAANPQFRVMFKPHPYTGQSDPAGAGLFLKKMLGVAQRSHIEVVSGLAPIFDCMNEADLLITDVSSVLNDYLHTLKPMILTNPWAQAHEVLWQHYPSSAATYVLDDAAGVVMLVEQIGENDTLFERRRAVCADSLGDFPDGSLATFDRVIQASVERPA